MNISHEFVPHLGGPCPECRPPERWTLEELREAADSWVGAYPSAIYVFLDWLEEQA